MVNDDRPLLEENLDRCHFHPERESISWRDLADDAGGAPRAVGVCIECAIDLGGVDGHGNPMPISAGSPCRCGPGFCASEHQVGFFGYCAGSRPVGAPDCGHCGAPHQSTAGCWICRQPDDPELAGNTAAWLRLLRADVPGTRAMDHQEEQANLGRWLSFGEAADEVIGLAEAETHEPPRTGWHFDGDRVVDDFTGAVIGFVEPRCSDSECLPVDPARAQK